jgi:hypothetical protein
MNIRSAVAALVTFAFASAASAQTTYRMGVTAGANVSTLKSDVFETTSGTVAPVIGVAFQLGFSDFFELNPEIAFTQKGGSASVMRIVPEQKPESGTYDYTFNTFELTLTAGLKPIPSVPVRIQVGGFMGSHFETGDSDKDWYIGDENADYSTAMPAWRYNNAFSGLDFGAALGLSVGEGRFRGNVRYYHGMKNLYDNLDFMKNDGSIKTQGARASLTWYF